MRTCMKYKYLLTALCLSWFYQSNAYAFGSMSDKLYNAAKNNNTAAIESYLRSGIVIDTPDGSGQTALCKAYYDKQWNAYNLLARYGANANAGCMMKKPTNYGKVALIGAGVAAVGAGIAIAVSSGGGGGGGGSGSSSNNNGGNQGDNSGSSSTSSSDTVYDSGNTVTQRQADIISRMQKYLTTNSYSHTNSSDFVYYTEDDFRRRGRIGYAEYSGYGVSSDYTDDKGVREITTSFLDGIRAAKAYSFLYGHDSQNNLVSKLDSYKNVVAVLDTGVDYLHQEFKLADGTSKVSGKSFDYGPCRGQDRVNCWLVENYEERSGWFTTVVKQKRSLYGDDGKTIIYEDDGFNEGELDKWAAMYPENYDWDQLQDSPAPLYGKNPLTGNFYTHGTHVAGIIAANWDRKNSGMMGVAFSNTDIYGLRWDLISPMDRPVRAAIENGAIALNISLGNKATSLKNASTIKSYVMSNNDNLQIGSRKAAEWTIDNYTTVKNNATGYSATDGMIWVMAAGNDSYSEPTILAGLKNLGTQYRSDSKVSKIDYGKLMMLTVVSVDVTTGDDGMVKSYSKSSFSNACGSTAAYCIAAPGGSKSSYGRGEIYSSTLETPEAAHTEYGGMIGTSQAAPVVTGSIAVLKSAFPFLHSSEIIEILMETANKTAATDYSERKYGAGLLDLGKAITYYIPPTVNNGTLSVATLSGDSVATPYISLNDAHLTVTSSLGEAVFRALPESMTIFDRYYRPFDVATSRYISTTHSGYKALKNDVSHIVPNVKLKHEQEGKISFSYSEAPMGSNSGFGFMDTSFKTGKITSGFFFSENTHYGTVGGKSADMNNPFMSFNSAYGAHIGYDITPKYGFKLQAVSGRNGLYDGDKDFNDRTFKKTAYAVDTELSFRPSKKLNLSFNSGMLYEDEALLGMNGSGAFGLPESRTYYTGVTAAYKAGHKWTFSGSYYQGMTEAQSFNSNMLKTGTLLSSSFALDANYRYDKTTDFGFRISSPLRIEHGKLRVDMASGRDNYSDTVYRHQYAASMKPNKREYKFALYANKAVNDNLSISSEFDVRVNPEHRATSNDYRALLGLAWNF